MKIKSKVTKRELDDLISGDLVVTLGQFDTIEITDGNRLINFKVNEVKLMPWEIREIIEQLVPDKDFKPNEPVYYISLQGERLSCPSCDLVTKHEGGGPYLCPQCKENGRNVMLKYIVEEKKLASNDPISKYRMMAEDAEVGPTTDKLRKMPRPKCNEKEEKGQICDYFSKLGAAMWSTPEVMACNAYEFEKFKEAIDRMKNGEEPKNDMEQFITDNYIQPKNVEELQKRIKTLEV